MKIHTKLKVVALLACFNASAQAADWAGVYGGVDVAYVKGDDSGKEYAPNGSGYNGWRQDLDVTGSGVGLRAGYNWVLGGNTVAGVEANYRNHGAKDKAFQIKEATGADCSPGSDCVFETKLKQSFSVTARLGYSVTRELMLYGLGGYTRGQLSRVVHDGWSVTAGNYKNTKWQNGYVLGLGSEFAFTNNLSVSFEYRYSNFGKHDFYTPAYTGAVEKFKYTQDEVSIGLNYRF